MHNTEAVLDAAREYRLSFLEGYPPYSPDLNPIGNLFRIAHRKMNELDFKEPILGKGRVERSLARFRGVLGAEVAKGTLKKIARSMSARLAAVIAKKGGPTKY